MAQGLGAEVRTSRPTTWTQCRQRGGAVIRGSLVMLDLAGSDSLTADWDGVSASKLGTQAAASGPLGTVLEATEGLTIGRVGVLMSPTVKDDGLGEYELGEVGGGLVAPVVVENALVLVDAASVAGAALQVGASGGTAVFAAGVAGATYGILLEDCTADDGKGPSASYNYRAVLLYSQGTGSANATLAAGSVGTAEIADDAVTSAKLDEDAVLRSHIADAAGMPGITRAALFEPGIAGSMQRCSFAFDPTDDTLTCRFKRRGLSKPAASETRTWMGSTTDRQNIAYVNTAGVYTVQMRETTTTLLTYIWTDDGEEHEWEARFTNAGCILLLDGVQVDSEAVAATFLTTSFTFLLGANQNSASVFNGDHATYRDVEVIDPATATNKVFLRLDEPAGGPYYNAYLRLGDPLYDATNTSAVTIATTGTDTSRPKSARVNSVDGGAGVVQESDRTRRMRVAAFSGLGDHATAGAFGSVSWAPTGTPAFNVEFDCRRSLTQGAEVLVFGRLAAQYGTIVVTAAGVVRAQVNASVICTTTAVALPPDGRVRRVRVEFRDSGADVTAAIYVGGRFIVSGTLAATQFSAVAADHYVGGNTAGRRFSGTVFNVLIEDLNSAANSGFWLMDEPRGSTTYANTYPGTSLAGLTINGFVSSCGVESEDGKGRPWQPGDGGAFRYGARLLADAAGITGVTPQTITGLTEDERDPTGHYAAGVFTAPCAGVAVFNCNASIAATTLAGADDITLGVTATSGDVYSSKATLTAANVYVPMAASGIAVLAAGDTLTAAFASLPLADIYTIAAGSAFHIDFTPTPVAG
jgi:hypothetical protein